VEIVFLTLLVDLIIIIYYRNLEILPIHNQLSKEIDKINQCIQKLKTSQKHYSHRSNGRYALGLRGRLHVRFCGRIGVRFCVRFADKGVKQVNF
jgi:hypothetical protein